MSTVSSNTFVQHVQEDENVKFTLPPDVFADNGAGQLSYRAHLTDGNPLPTWLTLDEQTSEFSGAPPQDWNGSYSITISSDDGSGGGSTLAFDLVIDPVNDAPVVAAKIADHSLPGGAAFSFEIPTSTFIDVDQDSLSYRAELPGGNPLPDWLVFNSDKLSFSGTAPKDWATPLTVTLTAADPSKLTAATSFDISVSPAQNHPPTVNKGLANISMKEDATLTYELPDDAFADADNDPLSYSAKLESGADLPSWLTFNKSTHIFFAEPDRDYNGSISVTVTASDGKQSVSDTFSLTVTPVNDAPISALPLKDQTATEGTDFSYHIANNSFTDVDSATLNYAAQLNTGAALPDWLQFDPQTHSFSGTPPLGSAGSLTVIVKVSDADQANPKSVSTNFEIAIAPAQQHINHAPVGSGIVSPPPFVEDTPVSYTIPAGAFTDIDKDALTYAATLASGEDLPAWLGFNSDTQTFSGTPPKDWNGDINLKVTASDGQVSASSTFTLVVDPVNDAPSITALFDKEVLEDQQVAFVLPTQAFIDVDSKITSITAALATGAALPEWLVFNSENLSFMGTPPLNFNGPIAIRMTATDGEASTSQNFTLKIIPVDDPMSDDELPDQQSIEDHPISFALPKDAFSDPDTPYIYTASLMDDHPLPSWLTFNPADRSFSGTPPVDFHGEIIVKVLATEEGQSEHTLWRSFTLAIKPENDAPVLAHPLLGVSSIEGQPLSFALPKDSFTDVDGPELTVSANLADGEKMPNWLNFDAENNSFFGTPPEGYSGSINVRVTAHDGRLSASDIFTLTITPLNTAPVLSAPLPDVSSVEDKAVIFAIPKGSFSDAQTADLAYVATLANGDALPNWLAFNPLSQSFSGTPPKDWAGVMGVKVTASDGHFNVSDTFNLTINPVNDAPVALPDTGLATSHNAPLLISVAALLANDSDVEGDALTLTSLSNATHGAAMLQGNGDVLFTPGADYLGAASFTYTISDGHGGYASTTVSLDVNGIPGKTITGTKADNGLLGTGGDDTLYGLAGDDLLNGNGGIDTLIGGRGKDVYIVDSVGDTVIELAGEGRDTVQSSINYKLTANVEKLVLIGSADLDGMGNELANTLIGNSGNNKLDGGLGADKMAGGAGDDVYIVDDARDSVQESKGGGTDTIISSIDWKLGKNVENLMVTGAAIKATGNVLDNVITGNALDNIIDGAKGNDVLTGGDGRDHFIFNKGFGHDTITDFEAGVGAGDTLSLALGKAFDTFAEIMAVAHQVGDDLVLTLGSNTITLNHMHKADLAADDFNFL